MSDRSPASPLPRDALARLIEGVQTLFREHLALAKVELREDLRRTGRSLLLSAAGIPPLFVGYLLLMVAIALLIALALPGWAAFGIVAIANLAGGGIATAAFAAKARREKLALPRTGEELRRDREWLSAIGNGHAAPRPATAAEPMERPRPRAQPAGLPREGEPVTVERRDTVHP